MLPARDLLGAVIEGSISRAMALGEAVVRPDGDPVDALVSAAGALRLVTGKVVDVERRTVGGFARGTVEIEGSGGDTGRTLRIEIQNENLVALECERVLASVPDLITIVDSTTAHAVPTELVRYGQRVAVIAFACDPLWRTPRGLELVGPRAFGYTFDHVPLEAGDGSR